MDAPKGKYYFGLAKVGAKGQIVIPASARKIFNINVGDEILIVGDEERGLGIVKPELTQKVMEQILGKAGK